MSLPAERTISSVGGTITITPTMTPSNALAGISWSSSNDNVATVSNGNVTAKGIGTTYITATTHNGLSDSCKVTVLPPPMRFTQASPSDGETHVGVKTPVVFSYNQSVESVDESSIVFTDTTENKKVSFTTKTSGSKLYIYPDSLSLKHSYTVTVPEGAVTSLYGKLNTETNSTSFTTKTIDVKKITPDLGEEDVSLTPTIIIEFYGSLEKAENWNLIGLYKPNTDHRIATQVSLSENKLIIKPESALNPTTKYNVVIPEGSISNNMGILEEEFLFSFETLLPPLESISSYPQNKMTDVPVDSKVSIIFNVDCYKGSRYSDIRLINTVTGKKVEGRVSRDDEILTFTPEADLEPSTEYSFIIPSEALENAEGVGAPQYRYDFLTEEKRTVPSKPVIEQGISQETIGNPPTIKLSAEKGTIYYTTDGSNPINSGKLYKEEVILTSQNSYIRAVALSDGYYSDEAVSEIVSGATGYAGKYFSNDYDSMKEIKEIVETETGYVVFGSGDHYYGYMAELDKEYNVLWERTYEELRTGISNVSSLNGEYVCLNSNTIFLISTTGEIKWQKSLDWTHSEDVICVGDGIIALGRDRSNPIYTKFDFDGNLCWRMDIENDGVISTPYSVDISENGFVVVGQLEEERFQSNARNDLSRTF